MVFIQQAAEAEPVVLVAPEVEVLAVLAVMALQIRLLALLDCLQVLLAVVVAERKLVVRAEPVAQVVVAQVVLMLLGLLVRQTLEAAVAETEAQQLLAATAAAAS